MTVMMDLVEIKIRQKFEKERAELERFVPLSRGIRDGRIPHAKGAYRCEASHHPNHSFERCGRGVRDRI